MADIDYQFGADTTAAERAVARLEAKIEKLERQLKSNARTSRRGANDADADFRKMVGGAAALAGGIGLVTSATGLASAAVARLRQEFDDLVERQKKAAQSQQTYQQAIESAVLNAGLDPKAAQDLEVRVQRVADVTGVNQREVAIGFSNALSAGGALGAEKIEEAMVATLSLTRNVPEAQGPLVGSVLDVMGQRRNVTPEQALGFLFGVGTSARVVNPRFIAENLMPAVLASSATGGDTERESAAGAAALSKITADTTGAASATAQIALDAQLEKAFPDIEGLLNRVAFLQEHPEQRERFLSDSSFERKFQGPISQILTKGTPEARILQETFNSLPELGDSQRVFDIKQAQIESLPGRLNNDVAAFFDVASERLRQNDLQGGTAAIAREGLENLLSAAGAGKTTRDLARARYEIGSEFGTEQALENVVDVLESRIESLRTPARPYVGEGLAGPVLQPTAGELQTAQRLEAVVEALQSKIRDAQSEEAQVQADLQRETNRLLGQLVEKEVPPTPQRPINRTAHTE